MKKLIPFLILALTITSCGGDNNETPVPAAGAGELVLNADGKNIIFSATHLNIATFSIGGLYTTTIEATKTEGTLKIRVLAAGKSTGEFRLDNEASLMYGTATNSAFFSDDCNKYTGSVTFTEYDAQNRVISGTYSGTVCSGNQEKNISGSFNKLKY